MAATPKAQTPAWPWQPMDTAPKDRPILAWIDHAGAPVFEEGSTTQYTPYYAHVRETAHAPKGYAVIEWGGALPPDPDEGGGSLPDWWFILQEDTPFERPAYPVAWCDAPTPPTAPGAKCAIAETAKLLKDGRRLRKLLAHAGYWQDGSSQVVTLFDDDATRDYHITVGASRLRTTRYDGCSYAAVIDSMPEVQDD